MNTRSLETMKGRRPRRPARVSTPEKAETITGMSVDSMIGRLFLAAALSCFLTVPAWTQTDPAAVDDAPLWNVNTGVGMTPEELDLWNDPDFRRDFVESYKAETELEPKLTPEEFEGMNEILDLMRNEKMDEARQLLEKEIAANPGVSAVFDFTLGNIHFQQENDAQAVNAYQAAIEKFPNFRRAYKNLAIIHLRQGEFEKALPNLITVIEMGDHEHRLYGLLGYAHASLGNFISAESAYRMAILLDPDEQEWKTGLARTFFRQNRYAEAVSLTRQLIEEHPNHPNLWLLQANAYLGLNQPTEAAEIYEIVDAMGASTVDSLNTLGDIYVNESLFELAAGAYLRAMEVEPPQPAERAVRAAKVLVARGALEETGKLIEQIQTRYEGDLETEQRKDLLKIQARLAVASGAGEEEVDVLKEIVDLDPLDGEALLLLGQHYSRKGNNEQAIFYYERAAAIEKYEAEAKVRHAQALVKDGDYAAALPLLRSAQQIEYRESVQDYLEAIERLAKTR